MVTKYKVIYEKRFSIPAIAASGTYQVPIPEDSRQYWPLNFWDLANGSGVKLSVLKNQSSEKKVEVETGQGARENVEEGINFSSLSLVNESAVDASTADAAILVIRKVIEVDKNG